MVFAHLLVQTNGSLLETAPDELWDALSKVKATLWITPYPTGLDYGKLAGIAEDRGVRTIVSGGLAHDERGNDYFLNTPIDSSGPYDPTESFVACLTGGCCMQLLGGRIYPCSKGALLGVLNRRFGTKLKHEPDDYLELSDIRDVQEIERFRRTFKPMCRYCAHELATRIPWARSQHEIREWLSPQAFDR